MTIHWEGLRDGFSAALAERDREIERLANLLNLEIDGTHELIKECDTLRAQHAALVEALESLLASPAEFDDERLGYITVQISRADLAAARVALAAGKGEV